jgi:hypothetical protein
MRKCNCGITCASVAFLLVIGMLSATVAHAQTTVIGNWESGTPEGWIDWSNGQMPIAPPRFGFNAVGATVGTGAVQFNHPNGGYTQWLAIKLQQAGNGIDEWRDEFLASAQLAVDFTFVRDEMAAGNDFANIGVFVNAEGYGFTNEGNPQSVTPFTGYNGGNAFNPQNLVGTQTTTWTWDIADTHDGVAPDILQPNPGWIEIIFETFSNGGVVYHVDNVRLIVPEPSSAALVFVAVAMLGGRRWGGRR